MLYVYVAGVAHGIRCYKCGQYNEGVGSITPCINYTAHMLMECSSSDEWCIVSTSTYIIFHFNLSNGTTRSISWNTIAISRKLCQVPRRENKNYIPFALPFAIATLSKRSRSWKRKSSPNSSIPRKDKYFFRENGRRCGANDHLTLFQSRL